MDFFKIFNSFFINTESRNNSSRKQITKGWWTGKGRTAGNRGNFVLSHRDQQKIYIYSSCFSSKKTQMDIHNKY